jgi:hypothetical protein
MTDQVQSAGGSSPGRAQHGIFLPSMIWTGDRQQVDRERTRLLAMQKQLAELVATAQELDDAATWRLMAEASLSQLDRDIDGLFDWLEAYDRRVRDSGATASDFSIQARE